MAGCPGQTHTVFPHGLGKGRRLVDMSEKAIRRSTKQAKKKAKALADAARLTQASSDFKDTVRAEILEDSLAHAEAVLPTKGWENWGAGLLGGFGCFTPFLLFGFTAISAE